MSGVNRSYVDVNRLGAPVTKSMIEVVPASSFDRVTAERDALQKRLTAADERADVLEGRVSMLLRELQELINDDDGILVAAELCTGFAWHALQKHGKAIEAALKPAEGDGDSSTCTWQHVDDRGIWDTGCGTSWAFTDEGPKENGMKFCHACGKTLMVEDAGDDD